MSNDIYIFFRSRNKLKQIVTDLLPTQLHALYEPNLQEWCIQGIDTSNTRHGSDVERSLHFQNEWIGNNFLSRSSLGTLAASIINSCIGMNQLNCSHMAWLTKYKCIMITTVFLFVRQIDKNKYVIINHQFRQLKLCQAMSMCPVK